MYGSVHILLTIFSTRSMIIAGEKIPKNSKIWFFTEMFCYLDATQHSDVGEECGRCKKWSGFDDNVDAGGDL